ncbi:MAG: hypothetical protein IKD08_04355 [Alphaproteobacteria bacterium]|nr:hypothetical protein [Alphaproteobacteria bacterium]
MKKNLTPYIATKNPPKDRVTESKAKAGCGNANFWAIYFTLCLFGTSHKNRFGFIQKRPEVRNHTRMVQHICHRLILLPSGQSTEEQSCESFYTPG